MKTKTNTLMPEFTPFRILNIMCKLLLYQFLEQLLRITGTWFGCILLQEQESEPAQLCCKKQPLYYSNPTSMLQWERLYYTFSIRYNTVAFSGHYYLFVMQWHYRPQLGIRTPIWQAFYKHIIQTVPAPKILQFAWQRTDCQPSERQQIIHAQIVKENWFFFTLKSLFDFQSTHLKQTNKAVA